MGAVRREIIIDCNDPLRVAEFWRQVLGWQLQEHRGVLWAVAPTTDRCPPWPAIIVTPERLASGQVQPMRRLFRPGSSSRGRSRRYGLARSVSRA
jgi:Glyoxalase-like domain